MIFCVFLLLALTDRQNTAFTPSWQPGVTVNDFTLGVGRDTTITYAYQPTAEFYDSNARLHFLSQLAFRPRQNIFDVLAVAINHQHLQQHHAGKKPMRSAE